MNPEMHAQIITLFITAVSAFILALLSGMWILPELKKLKLGQEVRDDGPESHLKKQGTPTMGGIMILLSMTAAVVIGFVRTGTAPVPALQIMVLTLGFGLIGFVDDFTKIKKHNSKGLSSKQKLAFQLLLSAVFSVWVYMMPAEGVVPGKVILPFTGLGTGAGGLKLPIWLYVPFSVFVILGTDNGVNFTDGLDGLCSSVSAPVTAFFMAVGVTVSGLFGVSVTSAALCGALLGFLFFNAYPAKVFMGDTGSLAIGGFVAAAAVVSGCELYIVIVGLIYLTEVLSVILQVSYFKATHGKRLFKMSPIHHHFELCGNSETRIVAAFTIITIFLCALGIIGIWV